MNALIFLTVVTLIVVIIMSVQEEIKLIESAIVFFVLSAVVWFLGGALTPITSKKIDITDKTQFAKGDNFVVFIYENESVKSTDYDVVLNPKIAKIYQEYSYNIYGFQIARGEIKVGK